MKAPFQFHSQAYQRLLLQGGTREQIIEWLVWNDANGTYTDRDSFREEMPVLTLEEAREIMREQVERAGPAL